MKTATTTVRCSGGHFMHPGDTACGCGAHPRLSLVKTPPALPHHDTGKACETAACRAAMTATGAGLHVPVRAWTGHPDGTATAILPDTNVPFTLPGRSAIRYEPDAPRPFEVAVPCRGGAHHFRTVGTVADFADAFAEAASCLDTHADFTNWATAAARDLSAAFAPRSVAPIARVVPLSTKGVQA